MFCFLQIGLPDLYRYIILKAIPLFFEITDTPPVNFNFALRTSKILDDVSLLSFANNITNCPIYHTENSKLPVQTFLDNVKINIMLQPKYDTTSISFTHF